MTLSNFAEPQKQLFWGNLLLVICCAFYLVWWLLAFRLNSPIKGIKSGWILIPAGAAGIAAVALLVRGILASTMKPSLFPTSWVVWGGIAAYVLLFAVTLVLLHRPVTTELLLIIGWAMVALAEVNALYGTGQFSHLAAVVCVIIILAALMICLACYTVYYKLSGFAAYIDGMIPLILAALIMAGISFAMAAPWKTS